MLASEARFAWFLVFDDTSRKEVSGDFTKRQFPSLWLLLCYVWNIFGVQYMQKQLPPNG